MFSANFSKLEIWNNLVLYFYCADNALYTGSVWPDVARFDENGSPCDKCLWLNN